MCLGDQGTAIRTKETWKLIFMQHPGRVTFRSVSGLLLIAELFYKGNCLNDQTSAKLLTGSFYVTRTLLPP